MSGCVARHPQCRSLPSGRVTRRAMLRSLGRLSHNLLRPRDRPALAAKLAVPCPRTPQLSVWSSESPGLRHITLPLTLSVPLSGDKASTASGRVCGRLSRHRGVRGSRPWQAREVGVARERPVSAPAIPPDRRESGRCLRSARARDGADARRTSLSCRCPHTDRVSTTWNPHSSSTSRDFGFADELAPEESRRGSGTSVCKKSDRGSSHRADTRRDLGVDRVIDALPATSEPLPPDSAMSAVWRRDEGSHTYHHVKNRPSFTLTFT